MNKIVSLMINVISFKIKQISTKIFIVGMFLFILLGHCSDSFGQANGDYRSNVASGNWGVAATWQKYNGSTWAVATAAPAAANNVTILSGQTITMNGNPGACNALTINGTLAFSQSRTLAVSGGLTVSGGTISGSSTGIINVAGTFTVPVSTTASIQRVTLTITGATTINGSLTFATAATGTKSFYGLVTVNSGGSWACSVSPSFTFRGGITNNGSFNAGAGTSTFNTNSQSIGGSSALSFGGNVAISGTITISNNNTVNITSSLTGTVTGSAWINAANSTLNIGSALLATGTLTASANPNTVNYNGSIAQTVKPTTYYNLGLSGSLVKTITGLSSILNNFSLSGSASATTVSPLSIGGNLSVGGGTFLATGTTSTYTLLVGGTTSVTGTLTLANTGLKTFSGDVIVNTGGIWNETAIAAINMAGNLQNNASFTASTGLHTLSGSSKYISGTISIPNLTISGAYTNSNTLSVTTAFTVTGSLTQAASANLNIGGTLSIANLIATASGNTVSFNGSVSQTIPAFNYYNLTSSSSGARIFSTSTTIGIAGAFTSGTNVYTITSSLISFNGSLAQFIPAFSFNTLDINNSAGVSLNGVVNTNSLSLTSGILTTTSINTLTVTGTLPANISGYSSSKYINGPLSLTLPAGLINASYVFPIGKSVYNALSLENTNTTSGGNVVISAEVFDANCGGTAGVGMANLNTNRYWNTSFVSGNSNFTNAQISLTETGMAVEDAIGQSATLSGTYDRISNNFPIGSIIVSDAVTTLGYFAIGEKPSITIAATTQATEGGSNGLFTITTSKQFTVARTINITIAGTATNGTDYSTINTTVNFPANQTTVTLPVTVTNDNFVEAAETVILTVETGTGYAVGVPSVATVTITDNDIAGVNVSPTSGLITTEAGGTASFTILLNSQPTANVTVNLSSSNTNEGNVSPSTITFTPANWNTAQTITVSGVNDFVADGNIAYTIVTSAASSSDVNYNGLNPSDVAIANNDNDVAGFTVSPTSGLTTTEAGGTANFSIVLTSQPTANVSIGLSSNNTNEGSISTSSLTFTSLNWNVAQNITVTGVNDFVVDGNIVYAIVTAAASSSDLNYNGLNPSDVSVTNTDNDVAGITVSPQSGLNTSEAGGTAAFTVVLNSQPTANVSIAVSSNDLTEGTVAVSSLVFTTANWSTPQTVTITGVNDLIADGNIAYTIVLATAVSTDANYNGINPSDVSVTNNDNDIVGITVNPTSGLVTTEAGGTAVFTIVLNTQPLADVSIGLSSSNTNEGTVSPASLTFTNANWNTPRTVTATGVNDFVVDGNIAYTIVTAAATSTDAGYNGFNPSNVTVTNNDNDVAGFIVTPTSGLTTTEAGGTATFTVALTSQPTANVTINLSSSNTNEGSISPSSFTFTSANWNTAQTATITGVNDFVVDGNIAYSIVTAAATSSDLVYNALNPSDVSVTNNDNDVAGINVSPVSGLTTTEAGGTATFTIVLNSQPTANVSLGISSNNTNEGSIAISSLTFTSANWNTAQVVTVTGVNDFVVDGNIAYSIITTSASSTDLLYNGINPSDVSVTNTDNDVAGITLSPLSGLVTTEAGGTATFTMVLTSQPTANVSIAISSSNTNEGSVSPSSLIFTSLNWNTPRTVTITGVNDFVVDGNISYSIITAAAVSTDLVYNALNPSDVSVSNTDNDVAGINVSPISGLITSEAGGTAFFTVSLNSQPTANVSIGISSSNTNEGSVSTSTLIFTSVNWNTPQTVIVAGVDDYVIDGSIAYSIITAAATSSDGIYNGMNPSNVSVTNTDNDVAGITTNPASGLTTAEDGTTDNFTIVLNTIPTANVSIALSSSDLTEGIVSPASVLFTAANWNIPQTVTITGIDDFEDDGDISYSIVTAAAVSTDVNYSNVNFQDVGVVNSNNDIAGITINPISGLTTSEAGGQASFTMVLDSKPIANVSINLSSDNTAEGSVSSSSVSFNTSNWNIPQTITVIGVDDYINDGDINYNIITAASASTDPNYNGMNASDVQLINIDNDVPGISVSPIDGLITTETGGTASFTVVLLTQPTATVAINLLSNDISEGTALPSTLSFTKTNWATPQTVIVTGVNDTLLDGDKLYTIVTDPASSSDIDYSGFDPDDVTVSNTDLTPSIGGFSPTIVCYGSGASIVITGTHLNGATSVKINNISAAFVVNNPTQITATLPATATTGTISIVTPAGTAASATALTINPLSVGGSVSGGSSVCYGNNSGLLTLSGYTGSITKWQSSISPFSSWSDISNTAATYTAVALTQTTQFRAVVTSGVCSSANTATTTVTVTALPVASFTYPATPYCSNASNPSPTFSGGGVAGIFSSSVGLNFVSTATGQVNLLTTTAGTYTVTNTIAAAGGCGVVTSTSTITIKALPVATIAYSGSPYCFDAASVSVTQTGSTGGSYSALPAGLTINAVSGLISPASSSAGTYTVTYTIAAAGGCSVVNSTTSLVVSAAPIAPTLSAASPLNGTIICAGFNTGTVTATGGSGGSTGAANEYQYSINGGSTYSSYTNGAAITTTAATTSVIVQARRTGGSICSNTAWTTLCSWPISTATVNPSLNIASPASGNTICAGYSPSATITAGSGGSNGAADLYQYSINNGTAWSTYTSAATITTAGATTNVLIRVSRSAGSYGCSATGPTTIVTWPVSSVTVNPTLNIASPASASTICAGYSPSATIIAGSGGSNGAADLYQYSINNGTAWSTYTSAAAITTTGATTNVLIRVSRSAGSYGCSATGPTTIVTWPVSSATVNPTLNIASPASASTICAGYSPSATITAGSGGSNGAADLYQYSINNGTAWSTYTSASAITTTGATTNVLIRVSRSAGSYGCSATGPTTIVTWPVSSVTVNPTLNIASPASGTTICAGYSPNATITAGSGGSNGSADLYEYSINNGTNWFTYTSGSAITTTGATTNVLIRVSRSAGSYGCSATGPTTIVTWPV
ncbi:MAG: Calx-beta domain-containing protein, partial [Bacteroidota bacterium]